MPQNSSARKDDDSFRLPAQEGNESTARSCNRVQSTLARGSKTLCIPFDPQSYRELVGNEVDFRRHVDEQYARHPELFPAARDQGYRLHDIRPASKKLGVRLRRIELKATGAVYSLCPSFVMPYMSGFTRDVRDALFLSTFGVPFWALSQVFGRDEMYWYPLSVALGRNGIVGTAVKHPEHQPKDLLADEKHTSLHGEKVYLATTVGQGCILGAALCEGADAEALTQGYGIFAKEARNLDPDYQPDTVNIDGWAATARAWVTLFTQVTILQCFLHAFLKIRERCKKWGSWFTEISTAVWDAYHAPNKRSFSQRIRRLREWAQRNLEPGVVRDKVLALCDKAPLFAQAYDHPDAYRTSNMVDRLMRRQDRFLFNRQYFHRSLEAAELAIRAWALLQNFRPFSPRTLGTCADGACAAERLNGLRYCDDWLENLRISSSMAGHRA
jgi:hypothetical protein